MKIKSTLLVFVSAITWQANAQYTLTDSMNLGEDSLTHGYIAVGNVAPGSYGCGGDTSIRVGNSSGGDYIQFNMAVSPGTDTIYFEITMPWHGGSPGQEPKMWVENTWNASVPFGGLGSCVPFGGIQFNGVSSMTGDGYVVVKLLDSLAGFPMDGQFTWIRVWSYDLSSVGENAKDKRFEIYPNPSNGLFTIKGDVNSMQRMDIYNAAGALVHTAYTRGASQLDVRFLSSGLYLLKSGNFTKRFVIE